MYTVKLFPFECQFASIEVALTAGQEPDKAFIEHIAKTLGGVNYIAPKWPKGHACPICGKGMVTFQKFQAKKPGPNQGKTYMKYGCSDKACSFIAWVNDEASKIPNDEPWKSAFIEANGLKSTLPSGRGQSLVTSQAAPESSMDDSLDDDFPF